MYPRVEPTIPASLETKYKLFRCDIASCMHFTRIDLNLLSEQSYQEFILKADMPVIL